MATTGVTITFGATMTATAGRQQVLPDQARAGGRATGLVVDADRVAPGWRASAQLAAAAGEP